VGIGGKDRGNHQKVYIYYTWNIEYIGKIIWNTGNIWNILWNIVWKILGTHWAYNGGMSNRNNAVEPISEKLYVLGMA
jgi:hypothetical protein